MLLLRGLVPLVVVVVASGITFLVLVRYKHAEIQASYTVFSSMHADPTIPKPSLKRRKSGLSTSTQVLWELASKPFISAMHVSSYMIGADLGPWVSGPFCFR